MKELNDISRIIAASILEHPLSESEMQQLEKWLEASEANKALYHRIKELQGTSQIIELDKELYGKKMAEKFKAELRKTEQPETESRLTTKVSETRRLNVQKHSRIHKWYVWIGSAAAVFLLWLTISQLDSYQSRQVDSEDNTAQVLFPGKTGAVLTLASGETIRLDQTGNQNVEQLIDSVAAAKPSKTTNIGSSGKSDEIAYHILTIPAGEEYFCQLDDNTSVWLNSQTELRFPKKFGKNERKVYLKGEAFFDVTKDAKHPFIVSTEQGNITVYGTRFNVNNYAETPLSAVLVEGSIGFTTPQGKEVKIKPSEKLTYEQDKDQISVSTVDTSLYTAWVEHRFIFNGQPLEEIMTTLSRWYNFSVTFASDDIRRIRLSGQLYRHEDIRILLDSYEQTTGLKFQIENRNILITK